MTKDDIIRMAREAGFYGSEILGEHDYDVVGLVADLERFAALVAAAKEKEVLDRVAPVISTAVSKAMLAEREACAALCFRMWNEWLDSSVGDDFLDTSNCPDAEDCAAAIRGRGQE